MALSRKVQVILAKDILPIIDTAKDNLELLNQIDKLVSDILSLSVSSKGTSGVSIGLSEYIGEVKEIAKGNKDTGWKDESLSSLKKNWNYDSFQRLQLRQIDYAYMCIA